MIIAANNNLVFIFQKSQNALFSRSYPLLIFPYLPDTIKFSLSNIMTIYSNILTTLKYCYPCLIPVVYYRFEIQIFLSMRLAQWKERISTSFRAPINPSPGLSTLDQPINPSLRSTQRSLCSSTPFHFFPARSFERTIVPQEQRLILPIPSVCIKGQNIFS